MDFSNDYCYALIVPSDRGLSRSEVTSITTVVIRDPIRIKGSVTHLIVLRDSKVRKQSYTAKQDKGSIDLDSGSKLACAN